MGQVQMKEQQPLPLEGGQWQSCGRPEPCGTRNSAVAISGNYNVPQSPRSEKPRSYLFPGEEIKKLGHVHIPSIHSYN